MTGSTQLRRLGVAAAVILTVALLPSVNASSVTEELKVRAIVAADVVVEAAAKAGSGANVIFVTDERNEETIFRRLKATGVSICYCHLSVRMTAKDAAEVIATLQWGDLGGITYVYRVQKRRMDWRIASKTVGSLS